MMLSVPHPWPGRDGMVDFGALGFSSNAASDGLAPDRNCAASPSAALVTGAGSGPGDSSGSSGREAMPGGRLAAGTTGDDASATSSANRGADLYSRAAISGTSTLSVPDFGPTGVLADAVSGVADPHNGHANVPALIQAATPRVPELLSQLTQDDAGSLVDTGRSHAHADEALPHRTTLSSVDSGQRDRMQAQRQAQADQEHLGVLSSELPDGSLAHAAFRRITIAVASVIWLVADAVVPPTLDSGRYEDYLKITSSRRVRGVGVAVRSLAVGAVAYAIACLLVAPAEALRACSLVSVAIFVLFFAVHSVLRSSFITHAADPHIAACRYSALVIALRAGLYVAVLALEVRCRHSQPSFTPETVLVLSYCRSYQTMPILAPGAGQVLLQSIVRKSLDLQLSS